MPVVDKIIRAGKIVCWNCALVNDNNKQYCVKCGEKLLDDKEILVKRHAIKEI